MQTIQGKDGLVAIENEEAHVTGGFQSIHQPQVTSRKLSGSSKEEDKPLHLTVANSEVGNTTKLGP